MELFSNQQRVGSLDKKQCIELFEELNNYRYSNNLCISVVNWFAGFLSITGTKKQQLSRTLPKISKEDFELIFDALDDSHDFKVFFGVYPFIGKIS